MRGLTFGKVTGYVLLLCMFCLVAAYQLRISLDTVKIERTWSFFLPFLVEPFTNRLYAVERFSWEEGEPADVANPQALHRGDELILVNREPFHGMSTYLLQLFASRHQAPPQPPAFNQNPFTSTVRAGDGRIHTFVIGFPHCSCEIPTMLEASTFWIAPQMFCVLLGFLVVCLRPRALLAWAFLGTALSLSQLQFWPDWSSGFQQTATPMIWADWSRVPAVAYRSYIQHAWPAALLLASAYFYRSRRGAYRAALVVAVGFLVYAAIEALLEVSWSENYRVLAWLYRLTEQYRTELMMAAMVGVAIVAWLLNRLLGIAVGAIGLLAAGVLYREPSLITGGRWTTYADSIRRFEPTIRAVHNTPAFVALLFTAGCLLTGLIVVRRRVGLIEAAGIALSVPLFVHVGGQF
ncbi:MAG: hypothetical protein WBW33_27095, partial [Bryobacteraceae bacterium]